MTYKCWLFSNIQCSQQWAASRQGRSVPTSGCFARLPRARAVFLAIADGPNWLRFCSALIMYTCIIPSFSEKGRQGDDFIPHVVLPISDWPNVVNIKWTNRQLDGLSEQVAMCYDKFCLNIYQVYRAGIDLNAVLHYTTLVWAILYSSLSILIG